MKKIFFVLTIVFISFVLLNSETGKYADIEDMFNRQNKIFEAFIKGSEGVKDAKGAAALINNFTTGIKSLIPGINILAKKYGKLGDLFGENTPEELQAGVKKTEELAQKMLGAYMKLAQYKEDPEVVKAQQEFQKISMEMRKAANPEKENQGEKKDTDKE